MKSKVLIVVANYYEEISTGLCESARSFLYKNNIDYEIIYVPGAFEISLAIKYIYLKNTPPLYDGIITLGCIIKGDTYHFELLSNECIKSINSFMLEYRIPVGFGILTCNNIEQARVRSKLDKKNKGLEAASACVKMIKLLKK